MFGKKKDTGHRCEIDERGVWNCKFFEVDDKEGKEATGTDFAFTVSKENDCEPIMQGGHDILDKDEPKVNKIIEQHVRACKKGIV